ncbi:MAG TPA: hypothetical protein VIQ23_11390 [Hanamia sp.]
MELSSSGRIAQVVSIGFLGNIVANGNPGSYFMVQYIKLIKN